MKLLVVDDSAIIRKMIGKVLEGVGFSEVYEADNGKKALEVFSEQQPDFVTMDITMPEMSGIECLGIMLARKPDTKILMISAQTGKSVALDALNKGAAGFLQKPISKEELQSTVRELLG
ncbi:MAG: response regulator [Leptospirales bacterium]|jgi:two-component system chemotaxis response regulator CheY